MTQTIPPTHYQLFGGVDSAARTAAIAWMPAEGPATPALTIEQTPTGYATLQQHLLATGTPAQETLVVLEATGPYWLRLATWLVEAGFVGSVGNPARAHHFAPSMGRRHKTAASDAQMLAQMAAQQRPQPWTPPPAIYTALQQCLAQRERLLQARGQAQHPLPAWQQAPHLTASVRARQEALIAHLTGQIPTIDAELAELLKQDPTWGQTLPWLLSIPGIGLLTAAWLMTTTLNFTLCADADHAAAYAGLVPVRKQSGTSVWQRPRIGHSGHAALPRAWYLATLSAARPCPPVKALYERLRAAGKPMKGARCAAARKLLHLAFAVVKKGQVFDPSYQPRTRGA